MWIDRIPAVIAGALYFCAGIIIQHYCGLAFYPLISCLLAALSLAVMLHRRTRIFGLCVGLASVFLGASFLACAERQAACDVTGVIPFEKKSLYTFNGVVKSEPLRIGSQTFFRMEVDSVEADSQRITCCGSVQVRVPTETILRYGDTLSITARPGKPFSQKMKSRLLILRPAPFDIQKQPDKPPRFSFVGLAISCKQRLRDILYSSMETVPAGIISAMVLGDKSGVPDRIYQSMVETGTVHILVVSGLNTGIVIAILILCLKICLVKRKYFILFAGPFLILYSFMTGATTPVLRAALGAFICLMAFSLQRQSNIKNATFLALIVILSISPEELFGISTQLSFASVFSIIYLYPFLAKICRFQILKNKILLFFCQSCAVTLCAWFGTAGIILYHFGTFSLVTVPANLIIVPLATFATVSGFVTVFAGLLYKPLSHVFAGTCEVLVALIVYSNAFFARLPFACLHLN